MENVLSLLVLAAGVFTLIKLVRALASKWKALCKKLGWEKVTYPFHVRGRKLIPYRDAVVLALKQVGSKVTPKQVDRLVKAGKPFPLSKGNYWWFGGCPMSLGAAKEHTLVVGTTGSGKTITIRGFMQSLLPMIKRIPACRALLYDAKRDLGSFLASLSLHDQTIVLHPFDLRSKQWAVAEDITTPGAAAAFAAIYIPEGKDSNPYFRDAARDILKNIVIAFHHRSPGKWFLRDVILATHSQEALKAVLDTPLTRHVIAVYFNEKANIHAILSTMATLFAEHAIIAACWSKAQETFSLKRWVQGNQILLLPNDEALRPSIDALNKVLIKRASELLLEELVEDRLTLIYLDEARELSKLDGVRQLATKGRAYGVCLWVGYQSQKGMESLYSEPEADELSGLCANRVFLRLQDSSATWASKCLGEEERIERKQSYSYGQTPSSTTSFDRVTRPIVSEGEIRNLPLPTPEHGLEAYYDSSRIGVWGVISPVKFWPRLPSAQDRRTFPDFMPRPDSHQCLELWTPDDFRRLNMTPPSTPQPAPRLQLKPKSLSPTTSHVSGGP